MKRREFLASSMAMGAGVLLSGQVSSAVAQGAAGGPGKFSQAPLPYAFDALEPHIDARTMEIHYTKHHAGYVAKLNAALEGIDVKGQSLAQILANLDQLPEEIRTTVRNNGGGHANHALFWEVMSGKGGGEPKGELASAIQKSFGSYADFADRFQKAAATRFGSGWAWLSLDGQGRLAIGSTPNQDTPVMAGHTPILGLDVWEHAYYLKYQNRRPEYIDAFFHVIDWDGVTARYVDALKAARAVS